MQRLCVNIKAAANFTCCFDDPKSLFFLQLQYYKIANLDKLVA
jgi:hypothetical protein